LSSQIPKKSSFILETFHKFIRNKKYLEFFLKFEKLKKTAEKPLNLKSFKIPNKICEVHMV